VNLFDLRCVVVCARFELSNAETDLRGSLGDRRFATILADPPWQFANRTGKIAPEHCRLLRYGTMTLDEIAKLPIADFAEPTAHLYLWCPNALLPEGLSIFDVTLDSRCTAVVSSSLNSLRYIPISTPPINV
jgi:hypothetical protein